MKLVLACMVFASATARADVVVRAADGGVEVVGDGAVVGRLPISGPVYDVVRLGATAYVARGALGVTSIDVAQPSAPREVATFTVGRPAVRLATTGSQLLVIVEDYATVAYDIADPAQPRAVMLGAPSSTPVVATAQRVAHDDATAKVVAVRDGWVSIASDHPLHVGDRFEVRAQSNEKFLDPASGEERTMPSNEVRGVFAVSHADGATGSGPLPRGVIAEAGDLAVGTSAPVNASLQAPPLWHDTTRIAAIARPFLSVEHLGVGMITSILAEHYYDIPLRVGVEIAPVAVLAQSQQMAYVGTDGGTGAIGQVRAGAGYATDYFDVGLAVGGELEHVGPSSVSIAPSLRLGALDGLHLAFTNGYTLVQQPDGNYKFVFASLVGELAIPLTSRVTLDLAGGGATEWAYGTVGIDTYLRGSGGPGTLIFRAAIGGAYVHDETSRQGMEQSVSGGGPTIAVGFDLRR